MKISIIIVNYNLSKEIQNAILSILKFINEIDLELIIIDNNSEASEKRILVDFLNKLESDKIKSDYLDTNIGFGNANNFGFKKAVGEIICFLNPDSIVKENIFNEVIRTFSLDENIAVIGPKIISENSNYPEKSVGIFPNVFIEFLKIFELSSFYVNRKLNSIKDDKKLIDVDWVTGSVLFIRESIFEKVKGFDPDYFLYNEEVDLCKRIKMIGKRIVYHPSIKVNHIGSASSRKNYYFFTKYSYESKLLFIKKHFTGSNKIILRLLVLLQIAIQIFVWIIFLPFNFEKAKGKLKAFPNLIKLYLFN